MQHATNDDAVLFEADLAHGLEKASVLLRQGGAGCGLRVVAAAAAFHQFAVFTLEFAVNSPAGGRRGVLKLVFQTGFSNWFFKLVFGSENDKSKAIRSPDSPPSTYY